MKRVLLFAIPLSLILVCCDKKDDKPATPEEPLAPVAKIDINATEQTIRGFGGATVFRPDLSDADITTLFGNDNDNQLGLNILRIRVNPYGTSQWGAELNNAKRVKALGALIMATPWSPPASMKTNNNTTGGRLNHASYGAYAAYLKNFSDYMTSNGAPLYALSIQNEPDIRVTYESCDWTAQEMTEFIRNNTFEFGNTKLMAAESFQFRQPFTDTILNDATAASKVGIIGGHIYGGGLKKYDNALNKGKEVWMTEHLDTLTTWPAVLATAKEIHDCLAVANYNAYLWWYAKRFYGPINENGQITKRGYVMAQFSKYIRNGYQRIGASSPDADVYISAYKGSGKLVIVAINTGGIAKRLRFFLNGATLPGSFTPHITTATQNLTPEAPVNVSDSGFYYSVPASGVISFVSN
jgi:glucuronoarabinoxylan endo-1,4-beta-xylanase